MRRMLYIALMLLVGSLPAQSASEREIAIKTCMDQAAAAGKMWSGLQARAWQDYCACAHDHQAGLLSTADQEEARKAQLGQIPLRPALAAKLRALVRSCPVPAE